MARVAQRGAGGWEVWRRPASLEPAGRVLQRAGQRTQARGCHLARLRPHQKVWALRAPQAVPLPPPRGSPRSVRNSERLRGWVPGCGLQTKESPPPTLPLPLLPPRLSSPILRVPSPAVEPALLPPASRRAWPRAPGADARGGAPRAEDPEQEREAERLTPLRSQSCHSGGVGGGRSWRRARLHLEAPRVRRGVGVFGPVKRGAAGPRLQREVELEVALRLGFDLGRLGRQAKPGGPGSHLGGPTWSSQTSYPSLGLGECQG